MEEFDDLPEVDLAPLTVQQFKDTCKELFTQRELYENMEDVLKCQGRAVEALKARVLHYLESNQLDNFEIPGVGKVSSATQFRVSLPADPEKKQAFFSYLKENGLENLMTINYNTLNSFYKSKLEEAQSKGDTDFSLPGIEEAGYRKTIRMGKAKK